MTTKQNIYIYVPRTVMLTCPFNFSLVAGLQLHNSLGRCLGSLSGNKDAKQRTGKHALLKGESLCITDKLVSQEITCRHSMIFWRSGIRHAALSGLDLVSEVLNVQGGRRGGKVQLCPEL